MITSDTFPEIKRKIIMLIYEGMIVITRYYVHFQKSITFFFAK